MIIQDIRLENSDEALIHKAAEVLCRGGVVVFPSDSCYGLAADPRNPRALEKLFAVKKRPQEKAVSCIFRDLGGIEKRAVVSPKQRRILEKNLPGPFTFLLRSASDGCFQNFVPESFRNSQYIRKDTRKGAGGKIGVRIPDFAFTKMLAAAFNAPYTATSANISGNPPIYLAADIIEEFKNTAPQPDMFLNAGDLPPNPPSAVVDLTASPPIVVRKGPKAPDVLR